MTLVHCCQPMIKELINFCFRYNQTNSTICIMFTAQTAPQTNDPQSNSNKSSAICRTACLTFSLMIVDPIFTTTTTSSPAPGWIIFPHREIPTWSRNQISQQTPASTLRWTPVAALGKRHGGKARLEKYYNLLWII